MLNEFKECEICRSKSGSPILCESCLHNRGLINKLKSELSNNTNDIELWTLFHKLWSLSVGTECYCKKDWILLENHLTRLLKQRTI